MWFADLTIDCIFIIDVVLNFRTAFVITGVLPFVFRRTKGTRLHLCHQPLQIFLLIACHQS
jgi:hypothetical protein